MFPSPLEVDRFISVEEEKPKKQISEFPSPLEVNSFISNGFLDPINRVV